VHTDPGNPSTRQHLNSPTRQLSRILLVRLRRIGDVVLTTPAVRAIRERFPAATISYLVEPLAAPIVERNPNIDDVVVVEAPEAPRRFFKDIGLGLWLRQRRYDLAIDFHGGPRSSWFTWVSGAPIRIGYEVAGRAWLYTVRVGRTRELRPRHTVDNQWDLVEPLGIPRPTPDSHPIELTPDPAAGDAIDCWLRGLEIGAEHRLVIVHVGARIHFRSWPADYFVRAIAEIAAADDRTRFVVVAGPDEDTATTVVAGARASLPPSARAAVLDPRDWTLDQLHALSRRAALYIGCDTGPLHVAATTSVKIIGMYGPTLPETWAPWRPTGLTTIPLQVHGLPCRPCDQRVCEPGDFRCLTRIEPGQVVEAAIKCLER
jgi:ADP-heptose:LPS heptosyltransferase